MVAQAIDRSKYELEIVHLFNVPEAEQSKLGSYANYGSNFKRLRASPCHPEPFGMLRTGSTKDLSPAQPTMPALSPEPVEGSKGLS